MKKSKQCYYEFRKLSLSSFILFLIITISIQAKIVFDGELGGKKYSVQFFGFFQTEARMGKAFGGDKSTSIYFGAQRLRWGTKYEYGNFFGKIFLDFNQSHTNTGAGLPEMIKDAYTGYYFSDALYAKLGMMKAPIGMLFTTPGWNLDVFERNKLDKGLVLERDMGVMVSGRFIGMEGGKASPHQTGHEKTGNGFGYDFGIFNPAGRSASVKKQSDLADSVKTLKEALAIAGRLHYDHGELFHAEAAYAISQEAGGKGTEDFKVVDLGVNAFVTPQLNLKCEYISGQNINGVKDANQSCLSLTGAYHLTPGIEGVIKHYQASAEPANGENSSLGNTYIGLNLFITGYNYRADELNRKRRDTLQNNRIQIFVVLAQGGDDWTGKWGYTETGFAIQLQHKF